MAVATVWLTSEFHGLLTGPAADSRWPTAKSAYRADLAAGLATGLATGGIQARHESRGSNRLVWVGFLPCQQDRSRRSGRLRRCNSYQIADESGVATQVHRENRLVAARRQCSIHEPDGGGLPPAGATPGRRRVPVPPCRPSGPPGSAQSMAQALSASAAWTRPLHVAGGAGDSRHVKEPVVVGSSRTPHPPRVTEATSHPAQAGRAAVKAGHMPAEARRTSCRLCPALFFPAKLSGTRSRGSAGPVSTA